MANRFLLGKFGGDYRLRVSRPGFNVLSTTLTSRQLAFDSAWLEATNIWMSGSYNLSNNDADNYTRVYQTIMFGRTFSAPPMCLIFEGVKANDASNTKPPDNDLYLMDVTDGTGNTFYNDRMVLSSIFDAKGFYIVLNNPIAL